ncbi:MAG TPA: hypothetical protein VLD39_05220, partial [Gammaproteobacteria bacterium]|nr:hypothetical protein [Gammaproteobacteria bacterium]
TSALRSVREPFDVVDWFLSPQRLTPVLEGGAYRANPAFLLLPFALWWLRDRKLIGVLLPSVGYLAGLFLISDRVNLRYLVPALPMLTVAAATTMDRLMERVRRSRLRVATLVFGLTIVLAPVAAALWHKLESTRALPHAVGRESRGEFLLAKTNREVSGYARMVARVNERLSEQSRLLLLIEGRGHGFRPRVLQDNVLKNWPLLLPAVAQPYCLESSGITHVLVGTGTLNYFKNRGLDLEVLQWDRFEEFSARCLEPIDIEPGMALYRVKTPRT